MFRSLGLASDALAMQGRSTFEERDDFIIMRTASEPAYWHGNMIIRKSAPGDALAQAADFEKIFPEATHRTILWDVPGMDPALVQMGLMDFRYEVSTFDVLAAAGPLPNAPDPKGVTLRRVHSTADWAALLELQLEIATSDGYDPTPHRPFLAQRNAARRAQIVAGKGAWFGAFDGAQIVGSMGIFYNAKIARYQSVETRESHRRRGICTALLNHAGRWALSRAPKAQLVIIADAGSHAGRLYQRMGFALTETLVEATRAGY